MNHKIPPHAYTYTASFALFALSKLVPSEELSTDAQIISVCCLTHAIYDTISGGYVQRFPAFAKHLANSFWNSLTNNNPDPDLGNRAHNTM